MNTFRKYPRISQSYDIKTLEHLASMGMYAHDVKFRVSNKLHGANLSIYYDGKTVEVASRNHMLENDESFYNFSAIQDEVFAIVKKIGDAYSIPVSVYGELFGGGNYGDIRSKHGQIQKGVRYSPDIHFSAFDIILDDYFLNVDDFESVCKWADLMFQESLFEGTLQECLDYPNDFEDPTYKKFGLPKLEGNITEGIVVKPVKVRFFASGSRVILKSKNEAFAEKNSEKRRIPKEVEALSEEMTEVLEECSTYINANRLYSFESKVGELEQKRIGEFMKGISLDVKEDMILDGFNPDFYDKSEMKIINKFINTKTKELIFSKIRGEL